ELVRAVATFLREEALPALEGRNAYLARVSANTLEIVARELDAAPAADAAERSRLLELLGDGDGDGDGATLVQLNAELCRRLEAGEIGADTPGLLGHLRPTAPGPVP